MSKPAQRSYSGYARDAAELLGMMIRSARTERELTVSDVAERAGVSRGLVHRIEKGEMGCSIGAVFEVAAIVGLPLFEAEPTALTRHLSMMREKLTLLPKAVRTGTTRVKDDF
ncbi:MAG TPA: helix-turn-helix transcriptional regulator [Gammaproteobacteria bacterium]|nr:helix-turn-helix transcriptional regulator [Gammaproteobacteria bacterium]